jgi:hypothetical protein
VRKIARVSVELESARHDWAEGHRRVEAEARHPDRYARLMVQIEAVTDELRRRIGQHFTLAELATVYADADSWSREAVVDRAATPDWPRTVSIAADAAFHLYARGAADYVP